MRQGSFQLPGGSGEDSAACWGLCGTPTPTRTQPGAATACVHGDPQQQPREPLEAQVPWACLDQPSRNLHWTRGCEARRLPSRLRVPPGPVVALGPERAGTCLGSCAQPSRPGSARPQLLGPTWPISLTVKRQQDARAKQVQACGHTGLRVHARLCVCAFARTCLCARVCVCCVRACAHSEDTWLVQTASLPAPDQRGAGPCPKSHSTGAGDGARVREQPPLALLNRFSM